MARRKRRRRRAWPLLLLALLVLCIGAGYFFSNLFMPTLFEQVQQATAQLREETRNELSFAEVTISEEEVSDGYYYQQLEESEKEVYRAMLQGVRDMEANIYLTANDSDAIGRIYSFLLCDRPELFWCTGELHMTTYEDHAEVNPTYAYAIEERDQRQTQIDAAVSECLAGISAESTEYERVKYVFEYLVNTVDYDLNAPDNQNIYSALVNKLSVCAGYSRAAQYLLQQMGMSCIYVTGTIPQQGAHAWNIVRCGDNWYQMDVTFGDPVFVQAESGETMPANSINYDYLCCTDQEIMRNHEQDTQVTYPQCSSMDLNYYVLNGMYYNYYDGYEMLQQMNDSIYQMEASFTCKFASDELYWQAHDDVIQNLLPQAAQNLAAYYGLQRVHYTYVEEDVMDKLVIYWSYE